jgi:hypothetical protein
MMSNLALEARAPSRRAEYPPDETHRVAVAQAGARKSIRALDHELTQALHVGEQSPILADPGHGAATARVAAETTVS